MKSTPSNDPVQDLFKIAMANIQKSAFVAPQEMQPGDPAAQGMPPGAMPAGMPPGAMPPGGDPAMAGMPPGAMPPGGDPAMAGMPPEAMAGQPPMAEAGQPGGDPAAGGQDPYDLIVQAVRQVMQEMGVAGQPAQSGGQQAPQDGAQHPQQGGGKGKSGKVTPEAFESLQAAVAVILEHLGLVDQAAILQQSVQPQGGGEPAQPAQAQQEAPAEQMPSSGKAAELPPDAQPLTGPFDPNAGAAMATAGKQGRQLANRVGKIARLIRGA